MTVPTIEVETGSGSATANSYESEAGATTYHLNHGHPTEWDTLSVLVRERHLKKATQYIDITYGPRWKAKRVDDVQTLDWPRAWMSTRDGFAIQSDVVPQKVKNATSYAALKAAEGDTLITDVDPDSGGIEETSFKVGPITERIKYTGSVSKQNRYPAIERLLEEYLEPVNTMSRS